MDLPSPKVMGYLAVGLGTVTAVYLVYHWLDKNFGGDIVGGIRRTSAMADQAAENYGAQQAAAANEPRTMYNAARSAYAQSIGWSIARQGYSIPNWPTFDDWMDGEGPAGYTYGSSSYPVVDSGGIFGAILSVF